MSRLTGSEAKTLMEAYQSIYASQEEVTEEQIWEEVEYWVNSLLEDGHDLSEYTWEDMYEAYLNEAPNPVFNVSAGLQQQRQKNLESGTRQKVQSQVFGDPLTNKDARNIAIGRAQQQQLQSKFKIGSGGFSFSGKPTGQPPRPTGSGGQPPRPSGGSPSAPATAKSAPAGGTVLAKRQGVQGTLDKATGKFTEKSWTDSDTTRYQAQAAKSAPKPGTQAAGPESIKPKTPNPLMKDGEIKRMQASSQARQTGQSAFKPETTAVATKPDTGVVAQTAKVAATPKTPEAKPSPFSTKQGDNKPYKDGPLWERYDAYDIVLDYLLSEGHVDTLEEALYVMMEMDAEMIADIVEETRRTEYLQKKFNKENKRKSGSAHIAIPGKQNTGQALQKARESERHMRGDN
jgi:hypothetical protein